jgi:N-acetyl-alpha-D-glucosaminyl L-malate synthase BshA
MKIGITCYPTYGGSGVVATELGKELAASGHEVHFISYSLPIRLTMNERIFFHEVEVLSYPLFEYPPYDLVLATKMAEVVVKFNLDILHVHYAIPHSISAFLAKKMVTERAVPFVTTLHGTDITLVGNDRSYLPITRFGIEQSDAVTAVSEYLKARTIAEFNTDHPIEVVHNFVNCEVFKKSQDTEFRRKFADDDEGLLIHISNFRPVKRVDDVIELFARVRQKQKTKLLMVGDGPDRPKAEWLAEVKEVAGDVHFLGKRDDMDRLLSVSDLLALPSEDESFGLVALEAMASEVPVIATRVGGVSEVVDDGIDGFLFGVGDTEAMADAASRILGDEGLRARMGKAGREHARRDFCHDRIVSQYVDLYKRTIDSMDR